MTRRFLRGYQQQKTWGYHGDITYNSGAKLETLLQKWSEQWCIPGIGSPELSYNHVWGYNRMVPPSDVNVGFINPMKTFVRYAINPIEFSHLFEAFRFTRTRGAPSCRIHYLSLAVIDPWWFQEFHYPIYPLVMTVYIAMENDGPNRNRWFSQRTKPPFMVGIFHGYVSHNQMVEHPNPRNP